ncbi:MAG: hypothetical protein ACI4KB_00830 [Oscillospiraceae bacterium]
MFYLGNLPEDAENNFAYQATEKLNKERRRIAEEDIEAIKAGKSLCADWKIISVKDMNSETGMYSIMFETPDNKAIVAFRGSEILNEKINNTTNQLYLDWFCADFGLLDALETKHQNILPAELNYDIIKLCMQQETVERHNTMSDKRTVLHKNNNR